MGVELIFDKNNFAQINKNFLEALTSLVAETAEQTAKDAHDGAPERDGDLKASIHVEDGPTPFEKDVVAGTGLPDARAVYNEYGTGQRGESGNHPEPLDGLTLTYRSDWPGMSPQPYMTPAHEKNRQKFLDEAADLEKRLQ